MTEWIIIISVSLLVAFPDDSTVREESTQEWRPYESLESCNRNANNMKLALLWNNHRKAQAVGAQIKELDLDHQCIDASEAL